MPEKGPAVENDAWFDWYLWMAFVQAIKKKNHTYEKQLCNRLLSQTPTAATAKEPGQQASMLFCLGVLKTGQFP